MPSPNAPNVCITVVFCYSNKLVDFAVKYLILKPKYQLI